jgi:hypothetical protein
MDSYCQKCHDVYEGWFHHPIASSSFNNPPTWGAADALVSLNATAPCGRRDGVQVAMIRCPF